MEEEEEEGRMRMRRRRVNTRAALNTELRGRYARGISLVLTEA